MSEKHRRALLVAALGFLQLPPRARELQLLHRLLGSWSGIGHIVVGMERQGYVVSIKRWRDGGWTCTFGRDVMLSSEGFGSGSTPWAAVQQAAWGALRREGRSLPGA